MSELDLSFYVNVVGGDVEFRSISNSYSINLILKFNNNASPMMHCWFCYLVISLQSYTAWNKHSRRLVEFHFVKQSLILQSFSSIYKTCILKYLFIYIFFICNFSNSSTYLKIIPTPHTISRQKLLSELYLLSTIRYTCGTSPTRARARFLELRRNPKCTRARAFAPSPSCTVHST